METLYLNIKRWITMERRENRVLFSFWKILVVIYLIPFNAHSNSSIPTHLVIIPQGTVQLGNPANKNDESPFRKMTVKRFTIQRFEVTNAEFEEFATVTGYSTDAEKKGWGWVWKNKKWQQIQDANWMSPHGPISEITNKMQHPVVQVSWNDAKAYCQWKKMRLPSEDEWEYAAQGPSQQIYPWGDQHPRSKKIQRANYGTDQCCAPDSQDGFVKTASVGYYSHGASPFEVLDMAGNVWEWVEDEHPFQAGFKIIHGGGWGNNPHCLRIFYRHANPPGASLDMVGFRCVKD